MEVKSVSRKVFYALTAAAMVIAAVFAWGATQAHAASNTVAIVLDSGVPVGSYGSLQKAFNAVEDGQQIRLEKNIETDTAFRIERNKTFVLNLNGRTITGNSSITNSCILRVVNGEVTLADNHYGLSGRGALVGGYQTRCFRLDGGKLRIVGGSTTEFTGRRVADVYGGELRIDNGTFHNSIVVYNPNARFIINGGRFENGVNISAKGKNACYMEINGGEFIAKLANTGKTAFIKGGTFHYLRVPPDSYIHPEYTKVETTIAIGGTTEKAYRIEKRPPSVVFSKESGAVEYDPAGAGTEVTAKVVDSNLTTELTPSTFKWYKGDELIGEGATIKLNEPGTYKAVGTYNGTNYEAEYVVKPADISEGYTSSVTGSQVFTGFPYGSDFVKNNVKISKDGTSALIGDFTYEVVSTGENINAGAGAGTYTIKGTGKYTGELSGSFDIARADFSAVELTVSPSSLTYTGELVQPAVVATLKTGDRVYTLDSSEYTVSYANNTFAGTATATATSSGKNFNGGLKEIPFTIDKAANEVSVSIEGWTYGETAKSPRATANFNAEGATFAYKAKGAADNTYTSNVPTTPGEYTVKATIPTSDNYLEGTSTADFTIAPMQLTIDSATAMPRAYENGNTSVAISGVTFKNGAGNPVTLTLGTDYVAIGAMADANAGDGKTVTVTVTLANSDYAFAEGGNTTTTTVNIAQAAAPTIENVPFYHRVGQAETYQVSQSLAGKMPSDAGVLSYTPGTATTSDTNVSVSDFAVDNDGTVTANLTYTDYASLEGDKVTLPVTIASTNYEDATVNVVVSLTVKTIKEDGAVTIMGAPTEGETYGDQAFDLTANVTGVVASAGTWTWYSSDESVLKIREATVHNSIATVEILKPGSAMLAAVYEDDSFIGAAITESITVSKRPLTITASNQESIYVGGTLPGNPGADAYTVGPDGGGLVTGDTLSGVALAYSSTPVNTKPGTYSIVPSGASILKGSDNVSSNYFISYVNGTFEVKPKEAQAITAADVTATYGDTDKSVSASVIDPATGGGAITYAVKAGGDCIDVDSGSGALTIKKAGTATVTVTAAETPTYAQATKDVNVTIQKAESTPATVSDPDRGWTYDGSERRLVVVEGAVTGGTMQYSLDGQSYSSSVPTATNAGDYTVWYKVVGDENHNNSEAKSIEVTVYKANPAKDNPGPLTATVDDPLENVKFPAQTDGTWTWDEDPGRIVEHAGVNNFGAQFTPSDTANYTIIPGVIVTVNAAKGASSVSKAPTGGTFTYNGEAQELVSAGEAKGGTMEYSIDGEVFTEELPSGMTAGDYTIWYMAAGDENHNDSEAKQVSSKIVKADVSKAQVTLAQTSYVYDGGAKEPAVTVTLDGKTLAAGTDYDVSYKNNVEIGTATVTVTGKDNCTGTAAATFTIKEATADLIEMHRLYNPNSGEHFFTKSAYERDAVVAAGWSYEGVGWSAPETGDPVYRLYNPNAGEHHYTKSEAERDHLVSLGWKDEGTGWFSAGDDGVPLYRVYNPNAFANNHHYTTSAAERDWLLSLGWKNEGTGWYGL